MASPRRSLTGSVRVCVMGCDCLHGLIGFVARAEQTRGSQVEKRRVVVGGARQRVAARFAGAFPPVLRALVRARQSSLTAPFAGVAGLVAPREKGEEAHASQNHAGHDPARRRQQRRVHSVARLADTGNIGHGGRTATVGQSAGEECWIVSWLQTERTTKRIGETRGRAGGRRGCTEARTSKVEEKGERIGGTRRRCSIAVSFQKVFFVSFFFTQRHSEKAVERSETHAADRKSKLKEQEEELDRRESKLKKKGDRSIIVRSVVLPTTPTP